MSGIWNRNYSNCMSVMLTGGLEWLSPQTHTASYGDDNISVKSTDGSLLGVVSGTSSVSTGTCRARNVLTLPFLSDNYLAGIKYQASPSTTFGNTSYTISLGSGNTQPTFDDYALESYLGSFTISQANVIVEKFKYDSVNHKYSSTVRYVLQYTGASEVTVNELGICIAGANNNSTAVKPVMIYREVFDTPITLNQYESIIFEISQSFPIINYEPYPSA